MDQIFDFSQIFRYAAAKLEAIHLSVGSYLSGLSSAKTAALILFLMTLILVLCLVLVWYVKSIVASIQRERMLEREYRSKLDNRLNKRLALEDDTDPSNGGSPDKNELDQPGKRRRKPDKKALPLDFDWKKNAAAAKKEDKIPVPDAFQYQFKPQKLITLTGLIMDMLERKIGRAHV